MLRGGGCVVDVLVFQRSGVFGVFCVGGRVWFGRSVG